MQVRSRNLETQEHIKHCRVKGVRSVIMLQRETHTGTYSSCCLTQCATKMLARWPTACTRIARKTCCSNRSMRFGAGWQHACNGANTAQDDYVYGPERMGTMLMQPHSRQRQRRNAAHAKFKQDDGPLMPASLRWAKDLRTQRQRQPLQQPPLRRIPKPLRHLAASARTTNDRKSRCKIWCKYCAQQGKATAQ